MAYRGKSIDGKIKGKSFESESEIIRLEMTETGDDKGGAWKGGQFGVGEPLEPQESIFGEGDSVPIAKAFHCQISNTTGLNIVSATDVTSIFQSDQGSNTTTFNSTSAGEYLLIGSNCPFWGLKVKYNTLATVEPANVIPEIIIDEAFPWGPTRLMATNSAFPYEQYGWNVAQNSIEQIMFGIDLLQPIFPWNKVTFNINGTDEEYYWGRLRITSAITGNPLIEQIKVHTSRTENEDTGFERFFGLARPISTLAQGLEILIPNNLASPSNQIVLYTPTFEASYTNNRFRNNSNDSFGIVQTIKSGLDTSSDLALTISYYVAGTATGDIEFYAEAIQVADGFVYDGTSSSTTNTIIETISTSQNLIRRSVDVKVPVNELSDREAVVVNIGRDARSPQNPNDTLGADVVITNISLRGILWHP